MQPQQSFHLTPPLSPSDHVFGPNHASVDVVEYGDFECPHCKQAASAVKLMLARFDKRIRFAFRHFPLEEVHPNALHAAQAAECAGAQGKFWQMHDMIFERQSHLQLKQLYGYAEQLGLNMVQYSAAMHDDIYLQRVREDQRSGNESGVRATPTFFVNGRIQDVSSGLHPLFESIESELRRNVT